jgi:hypothetical protein
MGYSHLLGDQQHQLLQPIKALLQGLEVVSSGFGGSFAVRCPTLAALGDGDGLLRPGGFGVWPQQSPERWPRAFACSAVVPSQGGRAQLCVGLRGNSRDRQIRVSLVVGRSCRRWHLGPGVAWDVPLSPGHLGRCGERRVSPPGNDTPGTSHLVRSVGAGAGSSAHSLLLLREGASINGASESRCSHNAPAGQGRQRPQRLRHRSSLGATGLHEGGFTRQAEPATAGGFPPDSAARPQRRTVPAAADRPRWRPDPEPC